LKFFSFLHRKKIDENNYEQRQVASERLLHFTEGSTSTSFTFPSEFSQVQDFVQDCNKGATHAKTIIIKRIFFMTIYVDNIHYVSAKIKNFVFTQCDIFFMLYTIHIR
jgi:hypothetical protein